MYPENDPILLFCDSDEEGNITSALLGRRIIPDRQYKHFFVVETDDLDVIMGKFKIVNCKLVKTNKV